MDTEIRVSTESRPWRRKFSRRSSRDSNPWPFNHESGALTTELSHEDNALAEALVLVLLRWWWWCSSDAVLMTMIVTVVTRMMIIFCCSQGLLQELLVNCDGELKTEVVQSAAYFEHRLQTGQKAIYHIEAFVARFMAIYKRFLEEGIADLFWCLVLDVIKGLGAMALYSFQNFIRLMISWVICPWKQNYKLI